MPQRSPRGPALAAVSGFVTGVAAGLIGVGGGEFRIPVLVRVLKIPIHQSATINLLVGLCTVIASLIRRWGQMSWTRNATTIVAVMGVCSLVGAVFGAMSRGRLAHKPLVWIVRVYLVVIGLWMIYEAISHTEHEIMNPSGIARYALLAIAAFLIALASGVLGVAGGEMRIPALIYLFSQPIKQAGTLSLLVSVPTVAAGAATDWHFGRLTPTARTIAFLMGVASVAGALVGAAFVSHVDAHTLKGILGAILILATVRLAGGQTQDLPAT